MPITYADQFYTIDPGNPPAAGTALTADRVGFVDNNEDGFIGTGVGDTFNGVAITAVWAGDTITVNIPGVGNVTITGVTFYLSSGPAVFTPTDGSVLVDSTFVSSTFVFSSTQTPVTDFGPTCFTPGTLIETPHGPRLIETLKPGDMIKTLDNGPQKLLWVGRETARAVGAFAPVRINANAIGNTHALTVSQQHRVMISGWQAEIFYGQEEVLIAAKHLVNGHSIRICSGGMVDYIHLLFADHEVVISNGIPSESYFPKHALNTSDQEARQEVEALFVDAPLCGATPWQTARPVVRGPEATLFAA